MVRCNDEVEAQSCSEQDRWTFYETIWNENRIRTNGAACQEK